MYSPVIVIVISQESPLGLVLKNWRELAGGRSLLFKPRLIRLSEKMWPTYELDNDETWPKLGSFSKKLISGLISCIREDKYFNMLEYARHFMVLACQQSPSTNRKEQHIFVLKEKKGKSKKQQSILNSGCKDKKEAELDLIASDLKAGPSPAILVAGQAGPLHPRQCCRCHPRRCHCRPSI